MSVDALLGLGIILLGAGLMVLFTLLGRRKGAAPTVFRPMPAFKQLNRAVGLSVEEGRRLHVSAGTAEISSPEAASALAALSSLERLASVTSISDRPLIATSGTGSVSLLTQDVLRAAYRMGNTPEQYDPDRGRLAGPTPLSYVAGGMLAIHSEDVSVNILGGSIGSEAALLADAAGRQRAFTLSATDSLPAQAAMYASADEVLLGEEVYALPAYMAAGPIYTGSVKAQDVLRWVLAVALIGGGLFTLFTTMMGVGA